MIVEVTIKVFITLFWTFMIFTMFENFFERRTEIHNLVYFLSAIILVFLTFLSNAYLPYALNITVMILLTFAVSFIYYGPIGTRVVVSIIGTLLTAIIEVLFLFLLMIIYNKTASEIINNLSYRTMGAVLSKLGYFVVIKLICLKSKRRSYRLRATYWILFLFILIVEILAITLIFVLQLNNSNADMNILSVISSFGLLFSTFFSLYMYEHMSEQSEQLANEQLLQNQIDNQSKHMNEILANQNQLKIFRHDLSNHLILLQSYIEKRDWEGAIEYLQDIKEPVTSNMIDTGNSALDAIVNSKKMTAESNGIEFYTRIQIPENIPINPSDICIVFGNALDNAIEACEKIENEKKKIELSIINDDNSLICRIKNPAVDLKDSTFKTTKKDIANHGLGIASIKSVLAKYGSIYKFEYKESFFVCSFIIVYKIAA